MVQQLLLRLRQPKNRKSPAMFNVNLRRGRKVCLLIVFVFIIVNRGHPDAKIDTLLENQFNAGRLYAAISSRPGQSGRADGYILEGKELEVW